MPIDKFFIANFVADKQIDVFSDQELGEVPRKQSLVFQRCGWIKPCPNTLCNLKDESITPCSAMAKT